MLPIQSVPLASSLPSRGAWIEIVAYHFGMPSPEGSLPSRGAWIEIHLSKWHCLPLLRRSPHGERG